MDSENFAPVEASLAFVRLQNTGSNSTKWLTKKSNKPVSKINREFAQKDLVKGAGVNIIEIVVIKLENAASID